MSNEINGKAMVQGERGAFSGDPLTSWTLPSHFYYDPEIHAREKTAIFQRSWICVGHLCDFREAGQYVTDDIAGQPILVIRGRDGELRAFFNVCQHRGHELLKGSGRIANRIVCPYHAWTYDDDGALLAARLTNDVQGFDKADFPLKPLRLAIAAGLVFVNLDRAAEPFDVGYAGFGDTMLPHLAALPNFNRVASYRYDIAANWKIVVDNFSESYHIPVAHRELSGLYDTAVNEGQTGPLFGFFRNVGRTTYRGMQLRPDEPYLSWTVWPNLCLLSLPGSRHLVTLRMDPAGPRGCRERVDIYAASELSEIETNNLEAARRLFADGFNREDIALVESVQRGLDSLGFDQGRYVADATDDWWSESGLHTFHKRILEALG